MTIVVGLVSRQVTWVPSWVGDALWAATAYFVVSAAATRVRWWLRGAVALTVSFVVEISQLYHQPWIDQIRQTTLGHLALGTTFTWTDLVAYTAGVALGIAVTPRHRCLAHRMRARWWALLLVVAMLAGAAGCSRWPGPELGPAVPYGHVDAQAVAAQDSVVVAVATGGPVGIMTDGLEEAGFFCAQVRASAAARQIWCRGTYTDAATGDDLWASTVDIAATPGGQLQYLRIAPPDRLTNTSRGLSANASTDARLKTIVSASILRAWPQDEHSAQGVIEGVRRAAMGGWRLGHDPRNPERARASTAHADYFAGEGDYFAGNRQISEDLPLTFIAATDKMAGPWPISSAHALVEPVAAAPGLESAGFECYGPDKSPCRLPDSNQEVNYYPARGPDTVVAVTVSINGGTTSDGDFATLTDVGFAHGLTFLTDQVRPAIEERIEQARHDGQSFTGIIASALVDIDAIPRPPAFGPSVALPVTVTIGALLVPGHEPETAN